MRGGWCARQNSSPGHEPDADATRVRFSFARLAKCWADPVNRSADLRHRVGRSPSLPRGRKRRREKGEAGLICDPEGICRETALGFVDPDEVLPQKGERCRVEFFVERDTIK